MYISYDKHGIIRAISGSPVKASDHVTIQTDLQVHPNQIIGKRIALGQRAHPNKLKVAIICNWGDQCGIATYSELLVRALRPKVSELKIFAEQIKSADPEKDQADNVVRCWKRGESMVAAVKEVLAWRPDIVHIQHEFGIFPKATHFLKMLELLDGIPYVITLHSVYEHLDKTICTAHIKNMIVHSEKAKESLYRLGHLRDVYVIYHGCVQYPNIAELFNLFMNDYAIVSFGFGFNYKGVDVAIDAIAHLKQNQEKFKHIFYCYLCSENPHTRNIQQEYYLNLKNKIDQMGLADNVVILRGFLSESHICNFLRTAKLAVFSYKNDENNMVYGASGAVRNALANGIPVIASDCHHFDELEGIIPRPKNHLELAQEIDKVFSDNEYRSGLIARGLEFVRKNNWDITADRHLDVFEQIINRFEQDIVRIDVYNNIE